MLTSRTTLLLSVTSAIACAFSIAACGGKVAFVGDGDDGSGGSGAGPSTTSVTVGPSTTNASVSVVTSTSNSTGVGSFCDTGEPASIDSSECGDCAECAQNGDCYPVIEACYGDAECYAFLDCLQFCDTDECQAQCQMDHPAGVDGYIQILECIVCDACPNNCDAQSNCPF